MQAYSQCNMRIMMVTTLCAILVVLGSLILTSSVFWKKTPSKLTTILQQYGVKATFFDVGYLMVDYPNIVRQEYNQGNIVANHSWSHPDLTHLSAQAIQSQLTSTTRAVQVTIGVRPTFFRPPYGATNNSVLAQARQIGFTTVLWDGSAGDWQLPGVGVIITRLLSYAHNGAILLLHDGGGNRAQTVAALPSIITILKIVVIDL
jgi:peptidoglycan/xylan/chitin deacetylase (PgdA/CDA1 family)